MWTGSEALFRGWFADYVAIDPDSNVFRTLDDPRVLANGYGYTCVAGKRLAVMGLEPGQAAGPIFVLDEKAMHWTEVPLPSEFTATAPDRTFVVGSDLGCTRDALVLATQDLARDRGDST